MTLKHIKNLLVFTTIFIGITAPSAKAQVVTSEPPYPTVNDSIVVYFHADRGDGGLEGFSGTMYAHAGLITENSTGPTDWQYVQGDWGTTNAPVLTHVEGDIWKLPIGDLHEFYDVPESEQVLQLAFVFRNADGSQTGRAEGGGDIFMDLYEPGLSAVLITPEVDLSYGDPMRSPTFTDQQSVVAIQGTGAAIGTQLDSLFLVSEGTVLKATDEDTMDYYLIGGNTALGPHTVYLIAQDTGGTRDTTSFAVVVNPPVNEAPRPVDSEDGITYNDDGSVTLSLFAPYKDFVYVMGDFTDWKVDTTYFMNRYAVNTDSVHWWLTIDGLNSGDEYGFQYLVDGEIRIADPYSQKVLDPWNDQYISESTYPNLKPYPGYKTAEMVSVLNPSQTEYTWTTDDYTRPAQEDLVIYELLVRDFVANHDYATLIDTLDYLDRLGVNAIELMPVNEFEGNISWGYNPAFYFAPDKYYGPANDLKAFIDSCHARDIAVILDMVLNHSYGQSPLLRLYNEGNYGDPTAENPWYNVTSPNPVYAWGVDFDHESSATKYFVDRVNRYWLTEFDADGFRFDFTKGFTNNGGDGWAYDADRIAILKRMADRIWDTDSSAYVVLEHFTDNSEETELTNYGMMVWGNLNYAYSQSAMGYQNGSSLSWGFYGNRGWSQPNLVTYMESHDEPWLMYKNLTWGNSSGNYDIQELETALQRMQLVATFFLTYPGPKMMWQFGELGYDEELPEDGRTDPKPIHWEYLDEPARKNLYDFMSALLHLRENYPVFRSPSTNVSMHVGENVQGRRIHLTHSMNVTILGNFGVTSLEINPNFQHTGTWYEYFTGDTLNVTDTDSLLTLAPGQFKLFTTQYIEPPNVEVPTAIDPDDSSLPTEFAVAQNYPNPFNGSTAIRYSLPQDGHVQIRLYNVQGELVKTVALGRRSAGVHTFHWNVGDHASGMYFYTVEARTGHKKFSKTHKLLLIK